MMVIMRITKIDFNKRSAINSILNTESINQSKSHKYDNTNYNSYKHTTDRPGAHS
jgi:hypothetical protein